MSDPLGFGFRHAQERPPEGGVEQVVHQRRLNRLLAFCGRSIDDVVNSPLAKRELLHWFKVDKFIARRAEVVELERQWNPLDRSA